MSEQDKKIEILENKINLLTAVLLDFMDTSYQYMPPEGQYHLDRIGENFNKLSDEIDQPTDSGRE